MLTIEDLKLKIDNNSRLLGLDIGSKRIGISICDDKRTIANSCEQALTETDRRTAK